MSKYKLVPLEPTPKMVEAAEEAYMPFGDMDLALRMAILAAPTVQVESVAFCEDATLSLAECTLNSDREQVTEVEAPSNSLPSWSECNLRVGNSQWLKDNDIEPDHDSLTANPLHEFIYEYDDSDAYKSAWFLHRLEKLIDFIRSEQKPATEVAKPIEPESNPAIDALESIKKIIREDVRSLERRQNDTNRAVSIQTLLGYTDHFERIADAALAAHRKQGDQP